MARHNGSWCGGDERAPSDQAKGRGWGIKRACPPAGVGKLGRGVEGLHLANFDV